MQLLRVYEESGMPSQSMPPDTPKLFCFTLQAQGGKGETFFNSSKLALAVCMKYISNIESHY